MGEEHLRLAQEKVAIVVEGKVKPGQDAGLSFCVEIHDGVSADEEIDTGDGGILNKIVAAEDD